MSTVIENLFFFAVRILYFYIKRGYLDDTFAAFVAAAVSASVLFLQVIDQIVDGYGTIGRFFGLSEQQTFGGLSFIALMCFGYLLILLVGWAIQNLKH